MESQPQNAEFSNNPEKNSSTHMHIVSQSGKLHGLACTTIWRGYLPGVICLVFNLNLHLLPFFVCVNEIVLGKPIRCAESLELSLVGPLYIEFVRPNKKISVFLVTGMNNLGRVGTHFN